MSMALDIILAVVWIVFIALAAKKGFVHSLLEFASFAIAMVLAFQISAYLAPQIYENWLEPKVILMLQDALPKNGGTAAQQAQALLSGLPDEASSFAAAIGLNVEALAQQIKEMNLGSSGELSRVLADRVGGPIVIQMCKWILFSIFAVIISVVLRFLTKYVDKIFKLPVLKTANTALGAVLGGLKGLFVVALICMILRLAVDLTPQLNESVKTVINSSFILNTVNEYNPVMQALHGVSFAF